jgi:hypothetical protein
MVKVKKSTQRLANMTSMYDLLLHKEDAYFKQSVSSAVVVKKEYIPRKDIVENLAQIYGTY